MNSVITLPASLHPAFKELGVAAIYLFGSHAEGLSSPRSDIDIGILMKDQKLVSRAISTSTLYQKLYELLAPTLGKYAREFDIVFLQRASLELRAHVVQSGKLLFESDQELRLDFEEKTTLLFADFAPLRYQFDKAVLARL